MTHIFNNVIIKSKKKIIDDRLDVRLSIF